MNVGKIIKFYAWLLCLMGPVVANGNEWYVSFPYGTVWGISVCINVPSSWGEAVNNLKDSDGKEVTGGEHTGVYGWCKKNHPLKSG